MVIVDHAPRQRRDRFGFSGCGTCRPVPLLDRPFSSAANRDFSRAVEAFGNTIGARGLGAAARNPTPPPQLRRAATLAGFVVVALMRYPKSERMKELEKATSISVARAVDKSMKNFVGLPHNDAMLTSLTFVFVQAVLSDQTNEKSPYLTGYKNALERFERGYERAKTREKQGLSGLGLSFPQGAPALPKVPSPAVPQIDRMIGPGPMIPPDVLALKPEFNVAPAVPFRMMPDSLKERGTRDAAYRMFATGNPPAMTPAVFKSLFDENLIQKTAGADKDSRGNSRWLTDEQMRQFFYSAAISTGFGNTTAWSPEKLTATLAITIKSARELAPSRLGWGLGTEAEEAKRSSMAGWRFWRDPRWVWQAYRDALGIDPIEERIAFLRSLFIRKGYSYARAVDFIYGNPADSRIRQVRLSVGASGQKQYGETLDGKKLFDANTPYERPYVSGPIFASSERLDEMLARPDSDPSKIAYTAFMAVANTEPTSEEMWRYTRFKGIRTQADMIVFMRGQAEISNPKGSPEQAGVIENPNAPPSAIEKFFDWASEKIQNAFSTIADLVVQAGVAAIDSLCKGFKYLFGENVGGFLCALFSALIGFVTSGLGIGMLIIASALKMVTHIIEFLTGFFVTWGVSMGQQFGVGQGYGDGSLGKGSLEAGAVLNGLLGIFRDFSEIVVYIVAQLGAGLAGIPVTEAQYNREVQKATAEGRDPTAVTPSVESIAKAFSKDQPLLIIQIAVAVLTVAASSGAALPVAVGSLVLTLAPVASYVYAPALKNLDVYKGVETALIQKGLTAIVRLVALVVQGLTTISDVVSKVVKDTVKYLTKVATLGEKQLKKIWGDQAKDIAKKFDDFASRLNNGNIGQIIGGLKDVVQTLPVIVIAVAGGAETAKATSMASAYAETKAAFVPNAQNLQEANAIWSEALTRAISDLPPDQQRITIKNQIDSLRERLTSLCAGSPNDPVCSVVAKQTATGAAGDGRPAPPPRPPTPGAPPPAPPPAAPPPAVGVSTPVAIAAVLGLTALVVVASRSRA